MSPQRTPTCSFSARWARSAIASGGRGGPSGPDSAQAAASSSAADDDSPAPIGRSLIDPAVEAVRGEPGLLHRPGHPGHVVVPVATRGGEGIERERRRRPVVATLERHGRVISPGHRDAHLEVDRDREDEAVVVVGVLADEVDAPGSADDRTLPDEAWRRLSAHVPIVRGSARGACAFIFRDTGGALRWNGSLGDQEPASRRFLTVLQHGIGVTIGGLVTISASHDRGSRWMGRVLRARPHRRDRRLRLAALHRVVPRPSSSGEAAE